jgi:hypothetical protein
MNPKDLPADAAMAAGDSDAEAAKLLAPLLLGDAMALGAPVEPAVPSVAGIVIGELLALTDDGATPLVRHVHQPGSAAVRAHTGVDLHGAHIGAPVVLMFEHGDPCRPIVIGVLRGRTGWPIERPPGQVEVDTDGERMIVSAREQLVLRCGKASLTLTKAGKVLIEGSYVLSRSTGVNRVKGGSVQLN